MTAASVSRQQVDAGAIAVALALILVLILAVLGAPLTLVAMGAAGILGLGLLTRPRAATLLFVALLYANIPVVAAQFHGVPSVLAIGAPLLLLGVPLMSYLVIRRAEPVVTVTLFWIIAYLAAQVVSAAFSATPEAAALKVAEFASEGLVLYLLLTNAVRDWQTLRGAVTVLIIVGALIGGLSMFQELTGTYDNQYGGFAQTREIDAIATTSSDAQPRLSGPIGEQNRYAQVMLILLPLALFAILTAKSRSARLLAIVCGLGILGGMLLTFSRGAGVAMVILAGIAIALRYIRLRDAVLASFVLAAGVLVVAPGYVERIQSLVGVGSLVSGEEAAADGAILGRATSNLASLNAFLDYPLVGVGPGQFAAVYSQEYGNELGLRFRETARRAHSMPLEVAADTGILGVVTLGGVFVSSLLGLWRVRRAWLDRDADRAAWATAFMLSLLAYLLTALFLHISYIRYLWLLLALCNSAIWILDHEKPPASATAAVT